jgi:uncharacterized protein (DUF2141 family)
VSGEVKVLAAGKEGNVVVVLRKINSDKVKYEQILEEPGTFSFDRVLPGKYLARAFMDKNKNKKQDIGEVFPYTPAEPYTTFPDSIPVRSRWETEKVDLVFE